MQEKLTTNLEPKNHDLIMDIKMTPEQLSALGVSIKGSKIFFSRQTKVQEEKGGKLEIIKEVPKGDTLDFDLSTKTKNQRFVSFKQDDLYLKKSNLYKRCFKLLIRDTNRSDRIFYIT